MKMNVRGWIGLVILSLAPWGGSHSPVWAQSLRTDTFAVKCYDVGRAALVGSEGIAEVHSGWQDGREVNRVTYDPEQIDRKTIEEKLQQAGTYTKTLPASKKE